MTPEAHDRFVAYVSHLPQLTVSALMHVVGKRAGDDGLRLAGPGLRDTTRLAAQPGRDLARHRGDQRRRDRRALDDLIARCCSR